MQNATPPSSPAPDTRRRVPRRVPRGAEERPISGDGVEYFVDDRLAARVYYHSNGAMEWEMYFDDAGVRHGVERYGHENGRIKWQSRWRHGVQIGKQEQWDEEGNLICATRFVRGTGADLWFSGEGDILSEERHFEGGVRHGVERWWYDENRVWHEIEYKDSLEHGIERRWNGDRLERGYPRYFLVGERVTRRAYERARRTDPTLRPRTAEDDRPFRPLPPEALEAHALLRSRRA